MTQVWSNTSVFIKEEEFNWNINDFALLWNASCVNLIRPMTDPEGNTSGGGYIFSPDFQIGDKEYQLCILGRNGTQINVDGVLVEPADKLLVDVFLSNPKEIALTGGSLSINMEGQKISGIFGDPTGKTIQGSYFFKNQTSKVVVDGNFQDASFCINRHATQIGIKVKLYGPSPINNTISHESPKDTGPSKLVADLRAMLNRSADNADFNIECGGKIFPCHEFILRARSTVMDAMFQNEVTETAVRSMTVVDVGPDTMAAFLEYLYTGEITVEVDNMKELIYIADKYDLKGLMELCFRKLTEVEDHMVVDFLFMADKHNFVEFKKEAMLRINMNKSKYMEDENFVKKLQEVPLLLLELYKL